MCDLDAGDGLPVAQDHVVIGVTPDVVFVARAHCRRQLSRAIEHDDVFGQSAVEDDRRQSLVAELLVFDRRHALRRVKRAQHQQRRPAQSFAQMFAAIRIADIGVAWPFSSITAPYSDIVISLYFTRSTAGYCMSRSQS